jgi:biotin transport system permease protein
MISLYRPGNSVLHRVPAGFKLLGLFAILISFSLWGRNFYGASIALIGFLVLFALAGFGVSDLMKQLWQTKFLLLLVVVPQLIFAGLEQGTFNSVGIVSGILFAGLVTLTTKTSDIVSLIERLTRSKAFAFLIALSVNSIALVMGFSKSISEAGLARGVKRSAIGQIVTLFVVSLKFADDYAESLAARGIRV